MHGYLSADIICSEKLTVFLELRSRKTVRFSEQIMSADKYPCIVLKTNGDYCVYYPSNIFRTVARAGISLELGNITRIFPNFGWGILCHVTRFDQSRASENIWWIIKCIINYLKLRKYFAWADKTKEVRKVENGRRVVKDGVDWQWLTWIVWQTGKD